MPFISIHPMGGFGFPRRVICNRMGRRMPLSEVTFEGMKVTTFNKPEAYLVRHYGESFKILPPEEKRRVGINKVQIIDNKWLNR